MSQAHRRTVQDSRPRTPSVEADSGGEPSPGTPASGSTRYVVSHVSKAFNGAAVLHDVSAVFEPGQVHSLVGENGAGKSTLFKIMGGVYHPDAGELALGGERLSDLTPRSAMQKGVYLVPQEPTLMGHLSAAENLYVGTLPRRRLGFVVDWSRIHREAASYFERVGLDVDVETPARELSIAQQQLLECARALVHNCRVIMFDESTSPLTSHETEILFDLMRALRDEGLALGFISHRLDEVFEVSDHVTVLRDGRMVASAGRDEITRDELVTAMIGRPIGVRTRVRRTSDVTDRREVLRVDGLSSHSVFEDVSFSLTKHEVAGLAGLVGSGRTEIAETIFGLRRADAGEVFLEGEKLEHRTPRRCIDAGLIYLPEDRGRNGIFPDVDLTRNVTAGVIPGLPLRWGLISAAREEEEARESVARTSVRASSLGASINTLSGGNQQRAMFSRWLLAEPRVAIFDEPTRGVDIGAKDDIYDIISDLATSGLACLLISSDLEELALTCDRVLVIYEGRIVGEVRDEEVTTARLGELVVGGARP
ncbi:MAG: sugar ABC transporter ATP-binding protein [Actinomycetota bacterium]|nr:sugar ABC transporter ATP-binding protein [Actinomycetota bacterium]